MSAYLSHALGFFLQIGPCAWLSFLPFLPARNPSPAAADKGATWRFVVAAEIACVLLALVFPFALYAAHAVLPLALGANGCMLCAIALLTVAYLRFVREPLVKKLVVLCLVTFYALTQYVTVNAVLPFIEESYGEAVYSPPAVAAWAASTLVMFPVASWAFARGLRTWASEIDVADMRREFALVMLASVVYFGIVVYYSTLASLHDVDEWKTYGISCLFAFVMMLLFYWMIFRESVRRKRDSDYQRFLEVEDMQHKAIMAEVSHTRRMRHDMRHHFSALSDMLTQGHVTQAQDYLAKMIERTAQSERLTLCENDALDALLSHYVGQARDEGISCEVSARCGEADTCGIAPVDLTVIIGNALENAVLACKAIAREDKRWIRVRIDVVGGMLLFQVENACAGVRWAHGAPHAAREPVMLSAKAFLSMRSATRGCGLASIEQAARSYGGHASFGYDEHASTFITRVALSLPEPRRA